MTQGIEINGQTHVAKQYQIPYDAFEKYINGLDPKKMKMMSALDLMRKSFEFGYIYVALDKEDMNSRIANLTEQNLKWFKKADALEAECIALRKQLQELKTSGATEEELKKPLSNGNLSPVLEQSSMESESLSKRQEVLEDSQTSTDATAVPTLS